MNINPIRVLGVNVHPIDVPALHSFLETAIREDRKVLVLHVNVYALNLACSLPWLKSFFNQADLVFCDGAGVRFGAWLLGYRIPRRITYADWMWDLAAFVSENGFSLFFLGGRPGVADRAAKRLQARFPSLRILGTHHGYFDKTPGSLENEEVVAKINAVNPDILIVGFGMPVQEQWLRENWDRLNVHVALTGGAVFDYVSGRLRRAPRWMTEHGLEWLGRLLIEPRRLWRRYLIGNPRFLVRILLQRIGLPVCKERSSDSQWRDERRRFDEKERRVQPLSRSEPSPWHSLRRRQ